MFVIPFWIDRSVPILVYAFALLKGSAPERIVAAMCCISWLHGNVIDPYALGERLPFQLGKDTVEAAVILGLALCWSRWWLLAAGMLALLQVATDVADMILRLHAWSFGTAKWTWTWMFIASLGVGTAVRWRRRQQAARPRSDSLRSSTPPAPPADLGAASGRRGRSSPA